MSTKSSIYGTLTEGGSDVIVTNDYNMTRDIVFNVQTSLTEYDM